MAREVSEATLLARALKKAAQERFPGSTYTCTSEYGKNGIYFDLRWEDGPSEEEVDLFVKQWKEVRDNLWVSTIRRYSYNFLSRVVQEYCRCRSFPVVPIEQDGAGRAYVREGYIEHVDLPKELHFWCRQLSSTELEDFVLYYDKPYKEVRRSSIITKKDYSGGLVPSKAIVGDHGYGRLTGTYVRFSIVPVVERKGPHLVRFSHQEQGAICMYGVEKARKMLERFARKGNYEPEFVNGKWQW